jgi:transcriptional regulator with XRE-family HTH domain
MAKHIDPVDRLVGKDIRLFRVAKGLSQGALGEAVGVTFQQLQKYEAGANRVGSSRLAKIAKTLGVPVAGFFGSGAKGADGPIAGEIVTDLLSAPYAVEMLKALVKISDKKTRKSLVALAESISEIRH